MNTIPVSFETDPNARLRPIRVPSDDGKRYVNIPIAQPFMPLLQPARYKGAHGGRGGGKSHFFADQIVEKAAWFPVRIVCLREFQRSLAHSVKALLEAKIYTQGVGDRFEIQKTQIKGASGSLIIFEGMQSYTADNIRSLEDFDIAYFTEAHRASAYSLEILRPTIRKPGSEIWFDWNRSHETDPVEGLFYGTDPHPDAMVVEVNWRDNPWIPDVLIKEMRYDRNRGSDRFSHVWEGKFQKHSEARVFRNWRIVEFTEEDLKGAAGPYYGGDWGFAADPNVLVRIWVDDVRHTIYVDYEAYEMACKIRNTPAMYDRVPGSRHHKIIADSARPETIDYMRGDGFNIVGAKKGAGSVVEGVDFLQSYDIQVHPRCPHTIRELENYAYKVDKLTGEVTNVLADDDNHVIDSLRYGLENVRRAGHEFY